MDASEELRSLQAVVTHPTGGSLQRPPLLRVNFTSSSKTSEAQVALGNENREVVGEATGEKTTHGLKVLAQATLEAVDQLIGESRIELVGASLVSVVGEEAVLVLVSENESGQAMIGAALVRTGPVPEAAVRATLDAVNRRLMQRS
jgi:hypothetical protein